MDNEPNFWRLEELEAVTNKIHNIEDVMCMLVRLCCDFWFSRSSSFRSKSPSFNLLRDILREKGHWKNAPRGNPESLINQRFVKK